MSQESFKPEVSQEDIRAKLEQTLASLQVKIQEKVKAYKESVKDGSFEDDAEESIGNGEMRKEKVQKEINDLLDKAEKLKIKLDSGETLELENIIPFPEGMGQKMEVEIGGKNKEELIKELKDNQIWISGYTKSMMDSPDFTTSKSKEHLDLVKISLKDLGLQTAATIDEIYKKAQELGFELCPAEVGPQLRLQYLDQPNSDYVFVGMKPISVSGGSPRVFGVIRGDGGVLELSGDVAHPSFSLTDRSEIVFRIPRK